jgi:transposase-like protein
MNQDQREIRRKLRILEYADRIRSVAITCRYFGIARSNFHRWCDAYRKHGVEGLCNAKPIDLGP